jgi:hypothetical protein
MLRSRARLQLNDMRRGLVGDSESRGDCASQRQAHLSCMPDLTVHITHVLFRRTTIRFHAEMLVLIVATLHWWKLIPPRLFSYLGDRYASRSGLPRYLEIQTPLKS